MDSRFAGYNYGAQNYAASILTYRLVLIANLVVGAVAMLLFELCPQAIIRIFGSENGLYNEYAELCFRVFSGRRNPVVLCAKGQQYFSAVDQENRLNPLYCRFP